MIGKVLFFGNVCNYAYWFTVWGRRLGYECDGLLENWDTVYTPEAEDLSFSRENTAFIYFYGQDKVVRANGVNVPLSKFLERYDVIHCFSDTALECAASSRRYTVFHNVGSFGRSFAWVWPWQTARGMVAVRQFRSRIRFRRCLKTVNSIVSSLAMDLREVEAFRSCSQKSIGLPLPYDPDDIGVDGNVMAGSEWGSYPPVVDPSSPTVIMPARHNWALKGQNFVLKALKLLQTQGHEFSVVSMEWGPDLERSVAYSKQLGIYERFVWLARQPRFALKRLLESGNTVLVVEFSQVAGQGGYGGLVRDGLSVGLPIVVQADPLRQAPIHRYPAPVFHSVPDHEKIAEQLVLTLQMTTADRLRLKHRSRAWLDAELSYKRLIPRYFDHYRIISGG